MNGLLIVFCFTKVLSSVNYSNSFIAYYEGPVGERNFKILRNYGYVLEKKIDIGKGFYQFKRKDVKARSTTPFSIDEDELRQKDLQLLSFKQERLWFRHKLPRRSGKSVDSAHKYFQKREVTIQDSSWSKQWHLNPSHQPSMDVYSVWNKGYTGKGVTVAIVDDGIQVNHTDLSRNYNASLSYDIIYDDPDPSHVLQEEGHGTNCAGLVAAVKNDQCVVGTAYEASIAAIRLLDPNDSFKDSDAALALVYKLENIDIYSNSWGFKVVDDFSHPLIPLQEAALETGIKKGRNGKGVIYTFAAGNDGEEYDDCNVAGWTSSMYTITVNALAPDSSPAYYAEECSSLLVATYGGDDKQQTITTTGRHDSCIDNFQGTSAACPIASGIIALVLQTNPALTWRDVQHMIVEFSINTGLKNANFYINGAGKKVSLSHGFGLMNAEGMVNAAPNWKTVPSRISCVRDPSHVLVSVPGGNNVTASETVDSCHINYLEHVLVTIYFQASSRGYTSIYLVSPQGTDTRILRERRLDNGTSSVIWTFMSVHTWGENPAGVWTLRLQSSVKQNVITLYSWSLTLYGTVTSPLHETPRGGEYGGYCDASVKCKDTSSFCLREHNICVRCSSESGVEDASCVQSKNTAHEDKDANKSVRIGVGVGVGLGGFLVIGSVIAFLYYYKRIRERTNSSLQGQTNISYKNEPEI